jgi:hypothetical protein
MSEIELMGGAMPRPEAMKLEVHRLRRAVPFRPFALILESGDRIIIGHPENIAFDPLPGDSARSGEFYVITQSLRHFSTFGAVTSVALLDDGGQDS